MSKNLAHAPYNFVPLPERIIKRYESIDDLPTHNSSQLDEDKLLTGEVTFDIVAESPILIADGNDDRKKKSAVRKFVKDAYGRYIIPGSSLRGLLKSTMSILSLSDWTHQIDDEVFYYRRMADKRSELGKTYEELLNVKSTRYGKKFYSTADGVKAGYIARISKDKHVIYPAKPNQNDKKKNFHLYYIQYVDEANRGDFRKKLQEGFSSEKINFYLERGRPKLTNRETATEGKLVFTGPIPRKEVAYIFNEPDYENYEVLDKTDIQVFNSDFEFRKSKMEGSKKGKRQKCFTKLPENIGKEHAKPCFYINTGKQIYFGHTPFLRLKYNYSVRDLLKQQKKNEILKDGIDYVQALFGFTKEELNTKKGFASRINVLPSPINGDIEPLEPISLVLGSPRASALGMYLKQDLKDRDFANYNEIHSQIRGMKQYWIQRKSQKPDIGSNRNISSELAFLPKGSTFKATIKFNSLTKDELGLLLFALKEPTFHQIGMAKPYGYGVVSFKNINCSAKENNQVYGKLKGNFFEIDKSISIKNYIEKYQKYVQEVYGINLLEQESVNIFLRMKNYSELPDEQMTYMRVNQYDYTRKLPYAKQLLDKNFIKQYTKSSKKNTYRKRRSRRRRNRSHPQNRGFSNQPFADLEKKLKQSRNKK